MNSPLSKIRTWTSEKRLARLKELKEYLDKKVGDSRFAIPESPQVQAALDECVVIWLEILKAAMPEENPFELFEWGVLEQSGDRGPVFDLIGVRFLETRVYVDQFKAAGPEERLRLRSKLLARGMLG